MRKASSPFKLSFHGIELFFQEKNRPGCRRCIFDNGGPEVKPKDVKRKWKALRAYVQERWDKLTREELDQIEGNYDRLIGIIQEKYGLTLLQAERELTEFRATLQSEAN
jgi:uncharacterized protein YjbJ (UPF0337 family)